MQQSNFTPMAFYANINKQNFRRSYAYGYVYPLYVLADELIPFQFIIPITAQHNFTLRVHKLDGEIVAEYTQEDAGDFLEFVDMEERQQTIVIHKAGNPLPEELSLGQYYLSIKVDYQPTMYSEVFTCVYDTGGLVTITWKDEENLVTDDGIVIYDGDYENYLYLCTEIGRPEYTFEEEGESRDGYFFPIKQISEKKYRCVITAPEYLIDAMRLIGMSDKIQIASRLDVYDCDTFLITPKWLEQGDLAQVDIEFDTNTIAKKIGRGYAETI